MVTYNLSEEELTKGLQVLKSWNPEWMPTVSMTDMDAAEIKAVKRIFPSIRHQLYCDFHLQQAWDKKAKLLFPNGNLVGRMNFILCSTPIN